MCKQDKELKDKFLKVKDEIYSSFTCIDCKKFCTGSQRGRIVYDVCYRCILDRKQNRSYTLKGKLSSLCRQAGNRGKECNLDTLYLKELYDKQNGKCYYTNVIMEIPIKGKQAANNLISLDRVDPKKGYLKGNVVLCCWQINRMKNDIPYEEFIEKCKLVLNKVGYKITSS